MVDLGGSYLWIKALHVIFVIAWMAGIFYLPRLFVYHTKVAAGSEAGEMFKVMERKLLKVIMWPGLIVTWGLGLVLFFGSGVHTAGWMHAKLVLVIGLTVFQIHLAQWHGRFVRDANTRSEKFYRAINEVPTLLMMGIVILVIVRPF